MAALLGIAVTTSFPLGLIERRGRTVMRIGVDSLAVLIVYLSGVFLLHRLASPKRGKLSQPVRQVALLMGLRLTSE